MAMKTYKPEEIISKLRQVDVLRSQGVTMLSWMLTGNNPNESTS